MTYCRTRHIVTKAADAQQTLVCINSTAVCHNVCCATDHFQRRKTQKKRDKNKQTDTGRLAPDWNISNG